MLDLIRRFAADQFARADDELPVHPDIFHAYARIEAFAEGIAESIAFASHDIYPILRTAIIFPDKYVLSHIHQTAGKISGRSGF